MTRSKKISTSRNITKAKKMSKTINDLPPELLMQILKDVNDEKTVKNSTSTCKLWSEIAEKLYPWSVCIDLTDYIEKIKFLRNTYRTFNQMELREISTLSEINDVIDLLKIHGQTITQFSMENCSLQRSTNFVRMLNLMPNLETLSIEKFKGWRKVTHRPENLVNTKKLKRIIGTKPFDDCFLKCFQGWRTGRSFGGVACYLTSRGWVCKTITPKYVEYLFN